MSVLKRSISPAELEAPLTQLPFPPLTKSHILNCSYHSWYPRYRSLTPKARLIALSRPFVAYLRADGIVLPPELVVKRDYPDPLTPPASDADSDDSEDEEYDPSEQWRDIHGKIQDTIAELGGSVMPKLNWSAPKDATWISATNSMECRTANDIYLLLKSSDFVTHDLEQVWDGVDSEADSSNDDDEDNSTPASPAASENRDDVPYYLILRKTIPAYNPALEFRCFVRSRQLLCMCQRDLNHFSFLPPLATKLSALIESFHHENLMRKFPDPDFVFDVYLPPPYERVWLIDINPWAVRTDPLLFSWLELLTMPAPEQAEATSLRISISGNEQDTEEVEDRDSDSDVEEVLHTPEFRLVNRDDPEAYVFNTPRFSAHKLPKDVVDAGNSGEAGLREFMGTWREIVKRQDAEEDVVSS